MSRGGETIHEFAVVILVGETDRNATLTLDKPVVREFVEEVALGRIFNISHFLGVLGNRCAGKHSETKSQSDTFLHS